MARTKTPPKVGWHRGVSMEDYLAFDAWHGGEALAILRTSPQHVKAARDDVQEPTEATEFGTIVHCAVLEPDQFTSRYAVMLEGDGRTAAVRDSKAKIIEAGKIPVKGEHFVAAQRIRRLLLSHPLAGPALMRKDGVNEVTGSFVEPWAGLPAVIRPDRALFDVGMCIDLKTAADASPRGFNSAIHAYGYHVKAALYRAGFMALGGELDDFVYFVAENVKPYLVAVRVLDEAAIEAGEKLARRGFQKIRACLDANEWPGWSNDPRDSVCTIPQYGFTEAEEASKED